MLNYEDAYNDLVLFFIELVTALKTSDVGMKSDAYIVNYIAVSIKNQYIKMSKAHEANKVILFSDLSESHLHYIENKLSYCVEDSIGQYFPQDKPLTEWEYEVLFLIFEQGASVSMIAETKNKSRQSINQTKLRAIQKLRKSFKP